MSTRRIVVFDRVSADGYFAAPDGGLDWAVPDADLDKGAVSAMPGCDTLLFGRRTYENFEGFWPKALEELPSASDPHAEGRRSPELQAMAVWLTEVKKLVFSRTRKSATWKNTRFIPEFTPSMVEALKREPGKDILIFGSGSIVSLLTEHGLVDEYQFIVGPLLLGSGRPLIGGVSKRTRLELLQAKPFSSGNVMLRYACAK
ncbi:dihydrofolate reductase family protein [Pyxidicoccus parkwayensis]|uniref:Dihydrofolate reductase family protein n=1 Tax=Pyxidicoccus parkwayensis TaxID=2813578 RepID=A0ABX7P9K5_9BACT|nr:dihydrofolate reductase family protein [Pyxidicoccus parkwaysis]QSQ27204.1 dihydrofolate reductase family protein [Pyxidicoccus parkwaysis]